MIPAKHPIRLIRKLCDEVLRRLDGEFESMYAVAGRPSIPPERLLKARVLQALYTVRSDRQLCERIRYDLLYQWFLDMKQGWPCTRDAFASHCTQNRNAVSGVQS